MISSNLQSQPTWLETFPNAKVEYGFDSTGLWFVGDADGTTYPVRTNFNLDSAHELEMTFTFIYGLGGGEGCPDHSVCIFNTNDEPNFSFGQDSSRIALVCNCSGFSIQGQSSSTPSSLTLSDGNTYTCAFTYSPAAEQVQAVLYNGTSATGSPVGTLTLNEVLPSGTYRVAFTADQDNTPDKISYFTYVQMNAVVGTPSYPYPEVRFRVKNYDIFQILSQNLPDVDRNNIIYQLNNQTVWIPNWPYALKHGDEFTLYGQEALQVVKAYSQINTPNSTVLEVLYNGLQGGYGVPTGPGGSMSFNGTSTYLTLPASSDWAVGTGDFTVEWFQYQQETGGDDRIFSVNSWPSASIACSMETGVDTFYFWTNGNLINGGSISSLYNTWAHIAACRSSGTLYLFVNGTEVYSGANTDDITDNTHPLSIGAQFIENNYYQGLITNFQFIKGTALYTTAFTPPAAPISPDSNSKLCLLASSESALLTDSSPAAKTVTNNGVTFDAQTPF